MLKRIYLVSGILFSIIFPLISFHYQVEIPVPDMSQADMPGTGIPILQQDISGKPFDYRLILLFLYLSGITILLIRAMRHFRSIFKTISKADINEQGPAKLIRASQFPASFSFFNYVFINPSVSENEAQEIMNHEIVHVRQKHWFDLLLVEILRLIQWVNPFVWIYTRFIRLNHEYLADQAALQRTASPANYRAALINQLFESPVISLTNSFNYSLNKKRFDMMKKIISSPYRKFKVLLVLPIFAIVFYAFATPEYHYQAQPINPTSQTASSTIEIPPQIQALKEGKNNRIERGVTQDTSKYSFKIGKDFIGDPHTLIIIDGVTRDNKTLQSIDPNAIESISILKDKSATALYGAKGDNGVIVVTTKNRPALPVQAIGKKALGMSLKPPYPRLRPEDYPTFKGQGHESFNDWLRWQIKYPEDAVSRGVSGKVTASYTVNPDGTLSEPAIMYSADKSLGDAVVKAIVSSPQWEPPKNPESTDPFEASVTIKFALPDKISIPEEPFVVVEEMPMFPGGDAALLKYITDNIRYPESAKTNNISGRVIIRFVVNSEGKAEEATVLRGVDPSLDEEAIRVVNSLPVFSPGKQGGKPVPVYYMVPVTFSLTKPDSVKTNP
jgi:TonB family protein